MIQIQEINAFSDNYIWCLFDENNNAIVVDPGCANSVENHLQKNELNLQAILITHHHPDHIGGVQSLKRNHNCKVYAFKGSQFEFTDYELVDKQTFEILGTVFETIEVPGHTLDHIAFYADIHLQDKEDEIKSQASLFCGDTLFSGGCGRLFEGSPAQMLSSLNKLIQLPESTRIYCAHEYTVSNLKFAKTLMPKNENLEQYYKECKLKRERRCPTIPSDLATELKINPFLRFDDTEIYQSLLSQNLIQERSPLSLFTAVRKAKDHF